MAVYSPACHPVNVTGLTDIQIAVPHNGSLQQLGHATDMVELQHRPFFHDVHGDRNGGPQGPPIEVVSLGSIYIVSFALSSFNPTVAELVETHSIHAAAGTIAQGEVGQLVLENKAMRLLLHTSDANDTVNFWCAIARQPQTIGMGTKESQFVVSFECHRPPCGHPKADILWDRDSDPVA